MRKTFEIVIIWLFVITFLLIIWLNGVTLGQVLQLAARVHIMINQFEHCYYTHIENVKNFGIVWRGAKHVYNLILFYWVVSNANYTNMNNQPPVRSNNWLQPRTCMSIKHLRALLFVLLPSQIYIAFSSDFRLEDITVFSSLSW